MSHKHLLVAGLIALGGATTVFAQADRWKEILPIIRTLLVAMLLTLLSSAAPALAEDADGAFPPPQAEGVTVDLDCASLYVAFRSLNNGVEGSGSDQEFYNRGVQALRAHIAANADTDLRVEANKRFVDDAMQRWPQAMAAKVAYIEATYGRSSPQGIAAFMEAMIEAWTALRACDARYGHGPLPSPFAWIE